MGQGFEEFGSPSWTRFELWRAARRRRLDQLLTLCKGSGKNPKLEMAQTYSNDLRAKFLQAYENGQVSLRLLAERFGVSEGWAHKILHAQRLTGSTDRPEGKPRGFPSRLTPEIRQRLKVELGQRPDATLLELQAWLIEHEQVSISVQRLSAVLLEMGLRREKKVCTPLSRIPRAARPSEVLGGNWLLGLPLIAWSSWMKAV